MRVWTKCVHVWDKEQGRYVMDEEESESYEYEGAVDQFGKGGGSAPSPDPQIGQAALENIQLGKDWLGFAKDQFDTANDRQANLDAITKKVTDAQLATQNTNNQRADQQWNQYQNTFVPIENKVASDALNYDTQAKQDQAAAEARADVYKNADIQRQVGERNLASMGVNPASGRFTATQNASNTNTALAAAGAENGARNNVRQMGIMLRKDAAGLGRNLTGTAAQSYGVALNAGNSATNNQAQANNAFNANTNIMNQGFQGAMSGNTSGAGILNTQYGNQLNAWNAQQQADSAGMAGIGNLVGTLGSAYIMKSSKKVKENKKPYKGALKAVENMPVEKWKYKDGVEDEREHVGAYAEDFKKETGMGDGKTINVIDAIGVAMKAVQELNQKVDKLKGGKK